MVVDIKPETTNEVQTSYPTRFIELLKTLVESDLGPKPGRQKQVIDKVVEMQNSKPEDINQLLLRTENNHYDVNRAVEMY